MDAMLVIDEQSGHKTIEHYHGCAAVAGVLARTRGGGYQTFRGAHVDRTEPNDSVTTGRQTPSSSDGRRRTARCSGRRLRAAAERVIVRQTGHSMDVPQEWRSYNCDDYFLSPLSEGGWWDEPAQCWYIEPADRVLEDARRDFLIIGRPGVDGIQWGYRKASREFGLTTPSTMTSSSWRDPRPSSATVTRPGESRCSSERAAEPAVAADERLRGSLARGLCRDAAGWCPRLLAAVVRSRIRLAFTAERQNVGQTGVAVMMLIFRRSGQ